MRPPGRPKGEFRRAQHEGPREHFAADFQAATPGSKNLHYGLREHAMAAAVNGMALSKLRPFGATFFIFSDCARPAMRLAALMELPTLVPATPWATARTAPMNQPIEQLASLRAMPGVTVLRPGDANEVVEAYRVALQLRHRPAVLGMHGFGASAPLKALKALKQEFGSMLAHVLATARLLIA